MNILKETNFNNLGKKYTGKVRDVYIQNDKIIMVSTDRYSAFDRNLALIPCKGQVLTQVTDFWFNQTKDIVQNHVIEIPDPNTVVATKCTVLPVEMVVRGYITGVTGTSTWTLYQKGQRDFGDFVLPDGMKKNQKLDKPVITPTTKHEAHDRPLPRKLILDEKLPEAPVGMVTELSRRYVKICEQITGIPFQMENGDIGKRIEDNLKKYA